MLDADATRRGEGRRQDIGQLDVQWKLVTTRSAGVDYRCQERIRLLKREGTENSLETVTARAAQFGKLVRPRLPVLVHEIQML